MLKSTELESAAYQFEAKMPLKHAIPLGLQHVFAMFVGNLTPLLIITSACGLAGGEFADLQVSLLQNAMFVAGIVTLVQLYAVGPVGGKVPIIMGTSSGFLGVFNSVAATMGGGVTAYGAIMGASILGGIFESVLGVFLKPLRKMFRAGGHPVPQALDHRLPEFFFHPHRHHRGLCCCHHYGLCAAHHGCHR